MSLGLGYLSRLLTCYPQGTDQLNQGDDEETPDLSKTQRDLGADASLARNFWYTPRMFWSPGL